MRKMAKPASVLLFLAFAGAAPPGGVPTLGAQIAASKPRTPAARPTAPAGPKIFAAGPKTPGVKPKTDQAKAVRIKQLQSRAMAAKSPGGNPGAESRARIAKLAAKFASRLESENARIRPKISRLKLIGAGSLGQAGAGGGGEAVNGSNSNLGLAPNPCGDSFELKAIQATPPLDPGEWVVVTGCGFGPYPPGGELRLAGDFPGGYLKLKIQGWTTTQIGAELPMITGVPDMPSAKLQVVRKDGKFSNWLDVGGFRATKEVRLIHPIDVAITCGHPSSSDDSHCAMAKSHPLSESNFFGGATFASKWSQSVAPKDDCSALDKLGNAELSYTDLAAVNLHNGWVLAGYAWWWTHGGYGYVLPPEGFAANSSSSTIRMKWGLWVEECGGPYQSNVRYRVDLYAVGPKGVPYK